VRRALRGRMAERPRWTEPLTITVGVHSLWGLYRVLGLSGKRAVRGSSDGGCHERAEVVVGGSVWRGYGGLHHRPLHRRRRSRRCRAPHGCPRDAPSALWHRPLDTHRQLRPSRLSPPPQRSRRAPTPPSHTRCRCPRPSLPGYAITVPHRTPPCGAAPRATISAKRLALNPTASTTAA